MKKHWVAALTPILLAAFFLTACTQSRKPTVEAADAKAEMAAGAVPADASAPHFDSAFWSTWGDGQAELAGYDLVIPRYGEPRQGTAVTIFVTETFSNSARVKANPGVHPATDEFPVMKLNLVKDFPTGIYDYNLMTSAFVALKAVNGRQAGYPTKVSFSAQEWCGHVFSQVLFDAAKIRFTSHSYFDEEADESKEIDYPSGTLTEDALFHWARGMAAPVVAPGEEAKANLLMSLQDSRLKHRPVSGKAAMLSRSAAPTRIRVPAGDFEVDTMAVRTADSTYKFFVETVPPHRIVQWEFSDGEKGQLLKSERMKYWGLHGGKDLSYLKQLGLSQRPPRTM